MKKVQKLKLAVTENSDKQPMETQVAVPLSALSLAPKKIVTATGLSSPLPFLTSLGRIILAHLVL